MTENHGEAKTIEKTFSENIRRFRHIHGWTQKELAMMLNMSVSSVQKYELGLSTPTIRELQRIADVLGIQPFILIINISPLQDDVIKNMVNKGGTT